MRCEWRRFRRRGIGGRHEEQRTGNRAAVVEQAVVIAEFGSYITGYARSPALIKQILENVFVATCVGRSNVATLFAVEKVGSLCLTPAANRMMKRINCCVI
jgi:hypothetical protein